MVAVLTFQTEVSGKTLKVDRTAMPYELDAMIRVHDEYGWRLVGYFYMSQIIL